MFRCFKFVFCRAHVSICECVCVCVFFFRFIFVLHIIGGNMRYTRSELNDALAGFRPHHPQHEQHKMLQQIERKCYICQRFGFFFLTKPISWIIIKNWKKRNDIRIYKAYMDNSICYMLQNFRAIAAQNDVLSKHLLVSFSFFSFFFFSLFFRMNEWMNDWTKAQCFFHICMRSARGFRKLCRNSKLQIIDL